MNLLVVVLSVCSQSVGCNIVSPFVVVLSV